MRFRNILIAMAVAMVFFLGASLALAQDGETDPIFPAGLLSVLGVIAPLVWQLITKFVRNEAVKYIISNGLSLACGLMAVWLLKIPIQFDLIFILALMKLADTAYKLIWKPLLFNKVPALKGLPTAY